MQISKLLTLASAFLSLTAYALDEHGQEALQRTQGLLKNDAEVAKYARDNPSAQSALDQVKQFNATPEQKAQLNNIGADIFGDVAKRNNGESAGMQAELQEAAKNPEAFLKKLSPAQQAQLRELASKFQQQMAAPAAKK